MSIPLTFYVSIPQTDRLGGKAYARITSTGMIPVARVCAPAHTILVDAFGPLLHPSGESGRVRNQFTRCRAIDLSVAIIQNEGVVAQCYEAAFVHDPGLISRDCAIIVAGERVVCLHNSINVLTDHELIRRSTYIISHSG